VKIRDAKVIILSARPTMPAVFDVAMNGVVNAPQPQPRGERRTHCALPLSEMAKIARSQRR
jgi:hypothetical protein